MKSLNVTVPEKKSSATVCGLYCAYLGRRIPGKPPIQFIKLKLTGPIDGETSVNFYPGEPGFDDLAQVLDVEAAMSKALAKRFPGAEIKDIPVKEPKVAKPAPAPTPAPEPADDSTTKKSKKS